METKNFNYTLVRSNRRKTLGLQIKNAQLKVLAPAWLKKADIELFVQQKAEWIYKKISSQQALQAETKTSFEQGDSIFLFGHQYTLAIKYGGNTKVTVSGCTIEVTISELVANLNEQQCSNAVKQALLEWYLLQANCYLPEKVKSLASSHGFEYHSIKIRYYKSRWGSCNNRAQLTFNSLLMMAPKEWIDYVIIHELCHLKYLNHSEQYWQMVASIFPEFKAAKSYFKQLASQLSRWQL